MATILIDGKESDLKEKTPEELQVFLLALLDERFKLSMQKVMSEMKNTDRFKKIRRDIARIKTEINKG